MTWFEWITGFPEEDYPTTQARLRVVDGRLASTHAPARYSVGRLEVPTLEELRERTANLVAGPATHVQIVQGDVRQIHSAPESKGALFQVASQFNLLEMVGPDVTPEDGVTRYQHDLTQGPACAIAAGAATIYRNYLVPVAEQFGQASDRQIDCLADLGSALGNDGGRLWQTRNGYSLFTRPGLVDVDARLGAMSPQELDVLKGKLRIGLHWNVDVTDMPPGHEVSQAFCSALPVAYNRECRGGPWERFATLVLEAAYEATVRSALLNRAAGGSAIVFLSRVGAGAFGNDTEWVHRAIRGALQLAGDLDVRIVSYGAPLSATSANARRFN